MSSDNSFGGKLRKILASMCSLFVGASGVSQANPPGTRMPTELKFSRDTNIFGFGDFGWKLASGDAKKGNSWLVRKNEGDDTRFQLIGIANELVFNVGFFCDDFLCDFNIWVNGVVGCWVSIPKGILFDVMRHFERKYFPNAGNPRDKGTELSCAAGAVDEKAEDEVFLRFILWAFCGSDNAIKPDYGTSVKELREDIFKFAINTDDPDSTGDEFGVKSVKVKVKGEKEEGEEGEEGEEEVEEVEEVEKKYAVLKPGYFLGNFCNRVREAYEVFGYDAADMDSMVNLIAKLNNEKKTSKNQKHIGKCIVSALCGLAVGGALDELYHRLFVPSKSGKLLGRVSSSHKKKRKINKVKKGNNGNNVELGIKDMKKRKKLKKRRG